MTEHSGESKDVVTLKSPDWKNDLVISLDAFPLTLDFGEKTYILRVTKNKKLILN